MIMGNYKEVTLDKVMKMIGKLQILTTSTSGYLWFIVVGLGRKVSLLRVNFPSRFDFY